jgi:UDP-N-acetyl-D-mannosaminuronic acid dehydrogenase
MSINNKIAVVGGAGHIGLPFSCLLQNKGFFVTIIDTNENSLSIIKSKRAPFLEEGLEKNIKYALEAGLKLSSDIDDVKHQDFVIVTLGTSSNKKDIDNFKFIVNSIIEKTTPNTKIIFRSTIAINTCQDIITNPMFIEKNLKLAYCPERIAEGNSFKEILSIPQIIGTNNAEENKEFNELFSELGIEILNTNFANAEFVKLFSNTYRFTEFSLINEFHNIATENELNFDEIINLATHKYPRLQNTPRTGLVGGPCLPKDTETFLNSYSPDNEVIRAFQKSHKKFIENIIENCKNLFTDKKIIQLGITFKPESDDIRDSQSVVISNLLKDIGFTVYVVDPYVKKTELDFEISKYEDVKNLTENILITTNHSIFASYNLEDKKVYKIGYN